MVGEQSSACVGKQTKVVLSVLHLLVWVFWTRGIWAGVFGVVIRPIVASFFPVVTELILGFLALEPP